MEIPVSNTNSLDIGQDLSAPLGRGSFALIPQDRLAPMGSTAFPSAIRSGTETTQKSLMRSGPMGYAILIVSAGIQGVMKRC